jgi:flavin reductase (DIM6/NTAB) family NADH-FMN oxidoreductase RutF
MERIKNITQVDIFTFSEKVFDMFKNEWMLITAGLPDNFNTMTAAWGSMGILWSKPIVNIYIRPQRYTFEFTERHSIFSLCFFGHEKYREALSFCGSKSGRKYNKPLETGLTPVVTPAGNIAFQEARLVIDCLKLYSDDIKPDRFIDRDIDRSVYPSKDYHRFYIGEVLGCYELPENS